MLLLGPQGPQSNIVHEEPRVRPRTLRVVLAPFYLAVAHANDAKAARVPALGHGAQRARIYRQRLEKLAELIPTPQPAVDKRGS